MNYELQLIFDTFKSKGIEAYLVGGALRDILNEEDSNIADYDFATPLTPDEIKLRFEDKIASLSDNSSKFGTVFIDINGSLIELTTFRKDITRGRKPETAFTDSLEIDATRRDFTINALYMDINGKIQDPTGLGKSDTKNKILRTNSNVMDRLTEDPLRIMRAIRFMAKGYKPDRSIKRFLKHADHGKLLADISAERIRDELLKILSINPQLGLKYLKRYGILEMIIPEVEDLYGFNQERPEHHKWGLFNHSVLTAHHLWERKRDPEFILIGFLHDIGKPGSMRGFGDYLVHDQLGEDIIEKIFRRLKFSNKSIKRAKILVEHHMRLHHSKSPRNIRKTQYIMKKANIRKMDVFFLYKADLW